VSFEVQAVNAEIKEEAPVHFHLLHAPDHRRIHYAKICPEHGEVPNDEIVEGYEFANGRYVEFGKEELDSLRTTEERALTIDAFVPPGTIDSMYFDGRVYYLMPSGNDANEPYTLLETAMEKMKRWGVGQVVFSGREQLAAVRPNQGVLMMMMLNYDAEVRKPADIKSEITRAHTTPSKLRLAEELVGQWHDEGEFDFSAFRDRYQQKVKRAIEAKEKGEEIAPPEEEEPEVINLMDALKRSVAGATSHEKGQHRHNGRAKTAKRRHTRATRRRA